MSILKLKLVKVLTQSLTVRIMTFICDEVRMDIDEDLRLEGSSRDSTDAVRGWLKTKNLWYGPDYNGQPISKKDP
ncbi:hypothetical protein SEA_SCIENCEWIZSAM_65 [Arthrobacter phage ScienceWizSam]|uniref:Uncharacterized protein n=1 Tax=Arthrobacter phage ScienceWizSam TaxID=2927283 RepID=A0A9E7TAI4_9CAUD|nr:hypothetical protein QCN41_gp65 [Arthrobacter phage ScienceWizSam]UUG69309.1 hypothetical protein SEA_SCIENCEWIZSAM_65 [Arthrobacter phage ScienceWizSam]